MTLAAQRRALSRWVSCSTGIETCWANDGGPRPAYPYVELNMLADSTVGEDYRYQDRGEADDGKDMSLSIRQDREVTLSCRAFAKPGGHNSNAHHYLDIARRALAYPSVLRDLGAVGIAVGGLLMPITDISSTVNGERLSGAAMDVDLNIATTDAPASERTTYIERVSGTVTLDNPDGDPTDIDIDTGTGGD